MRFEVQPALFFRGRKASDFKPVKLRDRNGQLSKPRPPRYFADRENRHYLALLVWFCFEQLKVIHNVYYMFLDSKCISIEQSSILPWNMHCNCWNKGRNVFSSIFHVSSTSNRYEFSESKSSIYIFWPNHWIKNIFGTLQVFNVIKFFIKNS